MGWLFAALYDHCLHPTENGGLRAWRQELLADVAGDVLEIGAGTGLNLPHYPPGLRRLVLSEPDRHMRRRLAARARRLRIAPEILDAAAECVPLPDASCDVVVSTLVLCSVDDLPATLREVHRLLRPNGRLVYLEHVAAPATSWRRRVQRIVEPLWRRCADGCRLTRAAAAAIATAGFTMEHMQADDMRRAPPWVRPTIRGVARRA